MQESHIPKISGRYWVLLTVAGLFGSNAGDLIGEHLVIDRSHALQLQLPLLAVALVIVLIAEGFDRTPGALWYWLAVTIIPMASNDLARLADVWLGLGRASVVIGLAIALSGTYMMVRSDAMHVYAVSLLARKKPALPLTDGCYWIAMLIASTLGTACSDFSTISVGISPLATALGGGVLMIALRWLQQIASINRNVDYWLAVIASNAVSTAAGGFLAYDPSWGVGLPGSVALAGVVLAALLALPALQE